VGGLFLLDIDFQLCPVNPRQRIADISKPPCASARTITLGAADEAQAPLPQMPVIDIGRPSQSRTKSWRTNSLQARSLGL
jgi:hypothetical protein